MNNLKTILDLRSIATELCTIIASDHTLSVDLNFLLTKITNVEFFLVKCIEDAIETNMHPLIRNVNKNNSSLNSSIAANYLHIDSFALELALKETYTYKLLIDYINRVVGQNTFNIWVLDKFGMSYCLKSLGDYRIIEWERDHVRNNKYIP